MTEIIGPKGTKIEKYDFLGDLIGKKIIAKNGEFVGKVSDVAIKDYDVKGIFCRTPHGRVYIDKANFEVFSTNAIVLKIDPVTLLKGKLVFDSTGRKVGTVKKINRDDTTNKFKSIEVKGKIYKRKAIIKASQIATMQKNIILKSKYEE